MRSTWAFLFLLLASCVSKPKLVRHPAPEPVAAATPAPEVAPIDDHIQVTLFDGLWTKFFVNGSINGKPRKFRLDTGAYLTSLMTDAQTEKFPVLGRSFSKGFASSTVECESVRADEITVGHVVWKDASVERCAKGRLESHNLGMSFLDQHIFALNFSKRRFYGLREFPEGLSPQPMKRNSNKHIFIDLAVANETVTAFFDSGAALTFVDESFLRAHEAAFEGYSDDPRVHGAKPVQLPDMAGEKVSGALYKTKFQIGALAPFEEIVVVAKFPERLKAFLGATPVLLGAHTIVLLDWYLDLKANLWSAKLTSASPVTQRDP